MTDLLDERRQHNAEIIGLLKDIRNENRDMAAHSEEHEFIRTLIEREKAAKDLRKAVTAKVVGTGVMAFVTALGAGMWLLIKDYLSRT